MRFGSHGRLVSAVVLAAALAACKDWQTTVDYLQTPNTSAAYDIAVDSSRAFSDRRAMAMMVSNLEASKLRQLLVRRIPNGWYTTATNDMFVLAAIGDEGSADNLEALYDKVPDAREDEGSMLVMLHTAAAVIRNRMGIQGLEIARDGLAYREQREQALQRLTGVERAELATDLISRIPGKRNANTVTDVRILGLIGDESVAARLEAMSEQPDLADADLGKALKESARQIRGRQAG